MRPVSRRKVAANRKAPPSPPSRPKSRKRADVEEQKMVIEVEEPVFLSEGEAEEPCCCNVTNILIWEVRHPWVPQDSVKPYEISIANEVLRRMTPEWFKEKLTPWLHRLEQLYSSGYRVVIQDPIEKKLAKSVLLSSLGRILVANKIT
ncbi:uncharacterized protein LOC110734964 [Chenopodium quinoa]|uniref:uncharacterized protein LOC110734964 n=1 Tax=Chenopodium quinoa TaxID=63459 RepID=UPI000B797E0E|nr:uncharacterized protein LOC110734964 [Chenopodium quinoa]XP_021770775.1 uncharacterized protein LOC110734964 [Chenopodium quinoa]XP_021770776.1 uncharacterized protein LOC110734964 [Chenopodium quinoa]XP_021770777.1 uncharacterized protein LOC110734964 [Chenopodium quinoa]XP_021770778.1 uncharacterized protein LOC110734964 [Chenopodium quinoa]XP_021770779.1 uncharacterized protein LOC110734964 [Chenopodium quinoa]